MDCIRCSCQTSFSVIYVSVKTHNKMYSTAHALINPSLCLAPFRELRTNHSAISSHLIFYHLMVLFFQHGANICNIKSILSRGPLESER